MLRVYCDTGGFDRRLVELESRGLVEVHQFKYENRSKAIGRAAMPSNLKYDDQPKYTFHEARKDQYLQGLTFDQIRAANSRFEAVLKIVGKSNRTDAQHLDSAWMTGCKAFLTSDKTDIWSNRDALERTTQMRIFHTSSEWEAFIAYLSSDD